MFPAVFTFGLRSIWRKTRLNRCSPNILRTAHFKKDFHDFCSPIFFFPPRGRRSHINNKTSSSASYRHVEKLIGQINSPVNKQSSSEFLNSFHLIACVLHLLLQGFSMTLQPLCFDFLNEKASNSHLFGSSRSIVVPHSSPYIPPKFPQRQQLSCCASLYFPKKVTLRLLLHV